MKLLAIETSGDACSAALAIDHQIIERYELAAKSHTQLILPMMDSLLKEANLKLGDLDALAFGCGPGSFTGVRIATAVIQGAAFGANLPVVRVSTLATLAQHFFDNSTHETAFVAVDARMNEVFWGIYQKNAEGFAQLIGEEIVCPPQTIDCPSLKGVGIGSGWKVYSNELTHLNEQIEHCESEHLPRASATARLGMYYFRLGLAVPVEQAMPTYLRDNVAKKESER